MFGEDEEGVVEVACPGTGDLLTGGVAFRERAPGTHVPRLFTAMSRVT